MSSTSNKRAALAILSFLNGAIKDGSVSSDDAEGIEVAAQCIAEAFGVSEENAADVEAYAVGAPLTKVLDEFAKTSSAGPSTSAPVRAKVASAEDKAAAEKAKAVGNQKMAAKDYQGAIDAYGEAIALDSSNKVYFSNRAAAYSQVANHSAAVSDARASLAIDPSFGKGYSRLGHALFSSGEYAQAVDAYEKGLELDPTNVTMKNSLATARSRVPQAPADDEDDEEQSAPVARAAGQTPPGGGFGGFPGMGGGAGGMPDIGEMMKNPMLMKMAQDMMANGGMEKLMNNPMLKNMMAGMQGGGGMPDMSSLMNDPEMRKLAEQFGGAMGK